MPIEHDDTYVRASRRGPLAGLRVIDMTSVVMGPWATHILADYGADVVKIEAPGGDVMRRAGEGRHADMGPIFLHANRNKRSVVIDAKRAEGRTAVLRLIETADIFVHNVRRGAIEKLGLAYDDIARANPRAIYVSLIGYARSGPYADRPAYDDLIQGACGLASLAVGTGDDATEPRLMPALLADRIGGIAAVNAILAAVIDRSATGRGSAVDVPMFETMVELVLSDHFGGESFVPPTGPTGYARALAPNRRPYRTSDGYVCVLLYSEANWVRFFTLVDDLATFTADPRLCDRETRARHYDDAYGIVATYVQRHSSAYWLRELAAADIPAMPYHDLASLPSDPHLQATNFIAEIEHPSEGRIRSIGIPATYSAYPPTEPRPAPRLGEQSADILTEAGYSSEEIAALTAAGVTNVGATPANAIVVERA